MSDPRASMLATLNDIRSKPSTPGRAAAAANIEAARSRMCDYAARTPRGGGHGRTITFHEREKLMLIAYDSSRSDAERDRAKAILDGGGDLTKGDVRFLDRT